MNLRHNGIIQYLQEHGEASAQALAERFGVSLMTIRRDLAAIERTGQITRTHGGALLARAGIVEFSFAQASKRFREEKRAIALEIARFVEPGMSVSLDSGTTTLEVAKAIAGIPSLTVLTSSLAIASVLYACENIDLVLLGGMVRKGSPDLNGWLTEENLRQFRVQLAVVGADGITREGAYNQNVELTRLCQVIMENSDRTILAADHSKLGHASFAKFASLRSFDLLVTGSGFRPRSGNGWSRPHGA